MENMMEVWHDKYSKQDPRVNFLQRQPGNAYDIKQQPR